MLNSKTYRAVALIGAALLPETAAYIWNQSALILCCASLRDMIPAHTLTYANNLLLCLTRGTLAKVLLTQARDF